MKSLLCLLVTTCAALAQPANILVIIADDLGADSFPLTAAGGTQAPMPNITVLKNRGVLFTNAHAQPTCSPTRASMLTGRHPFRTGIGAQLTGATSPQLQTSEFTLPEAFAANPGLGYSLAMFGKWHLNSGAGTNDTPRTVGGWPHFAGTIIGALPDYSAWTKIVNNVATATTTYATTDTANDVIAFINSRPSGTPWFAWAAFNAPHTPLHVPPAGLHSYGTPATNRGMYEAMCQALDTEAGRILAAVNLSNTHVIFVGDNGTPPNVIQTPYTSAHAKETIYQGGTRVPLIIAGPSVVNPNRNSSAPVHVADLYSTILELAGISVAATQPPANPLDSRSLLPVLQNSSEGSRMVMSQMFGADLAASASGRVITDAAGYTLLQFDDGHEELFNVTTDVNQTTNLLGTSITSAAQTAYAALKLQSANYSATGVPNEPLITSWQTANSGQYARVYPTLAAMNSGASSTTWDHPTGADQLTPAYSDVHQVDYSTSWVYVHSTGLASHIMGPWYLDAAKTNLFPNYPANQAAKWRFPRAPVIPATKVNTGLGAIGRMVNGVSMFDCRDAFSYSFANSADATPGGGFAGDGVWNRDAYHNESVTFDPAYAHQAGSNYHYHAQPIALRYQLGDHVDFNPATRLYSESTAPVTQHSPIVAWAQDGLPVYGPYGYSSPTDASSGVRRMVSGFALRSGLTTRTALPAWAARIQTAQGIAFQNGPNVGAGFLLGHYIEDYDYLGDLVNPATGTPYLHGAHFDLNEQNARFCVTPEFPGGTWAYFTTITATGMPTFPYTTGRQFFGTPSGGAITAINEPVSTANLAGPLKSDSGHALGVNPANGNATLTWSGVEGGTYQIQASNDLTTWTALTPNVTANGDDTVSALETAAATTNAHRFYRTARSSLATYDRNGIAGTYFTLTVPAGGGPNTVTPSSGSRGTAVNVVIELDPALTPTLPVANVAVFSINAGAGIIVSNIARPSQTLVTATFTIDAAANQTTRNVSVRFGSSTGVLRTISNGFTVL